MKIDVITQPTFRTTLDAIGDALSTSGLVSMDVAAAYITSAGTKLLLQKLSEADRANEMGFEKRWITSFDYCRTEPVALRALQAVHASSIRIHDAQVCLNLKGVPHVPFHPKAFLFRSHKADCVLAGSGNVSRSGLMRGYEAGLLVGADRAATLGDDPARTAIAALRSYFEATWEKASPLTSDLLGRYERLFESREHLRNPVPTEDDVAALDAPRGKLTSEQLRKLRICRHFWIEAGNITKNRGPHVPGNQLMMKKLSRVFFGFEPSPLEKNSPIGTIDIRYENLVSDSCSLTFSDNSMDKLVLPIPDLSGPTSYDNKVLLFERVKPGLFQLILGTQGDVREWVKKSKRIDAIDTMRGGRKWGVF